MISNFHVAHLFGQGAVVALQRCALARREAQPLIPPLRAAKLCNLMSKEMHLLATAVARPHCSLRRVTECRL
jgi:hypothetical protein